MERVDFPGPGALLQISYDVFGDVLYVKSHESRVAQNLLVDHDGFTWRLAADARPSGFTVEDFDYNWHGKARQLALRIEHGMGWPANQAESLTEVIMAMTSGHRRLGSEIFAGLPADRPITPRSVPRGND